MSYTKHHLNGYPSIFRHQQTKNRMRKHWKFTGNVMEWCDVHFWRWVKTMHGNGLQMKITTRTKQGNKKKTKMRVNKRCGGKAYLPDFWISGKNRWFYFSCLISLNIQEISFSSQLLLEAKHWFGCSTRQVRFGHMMKRTGEKKGNLNFNYTSVRRGMQTQTKK